MVFQRAYLPIDGIPRGKATNFFKQRVDVYGLPVYRYARVFSEQQLANGIESGGCNSLGEERESLVSPSHRGKCLFDRVHGTNLSHLMTLANTRRLNDAARGFEPMEECLSRDCEERSERERDMYTRANRVFIGRLANLAHRTQSRT